LYDSNFHGNKYVDVINIGKIGEAAGRLMAGISVIADTFSVINHDISKSKFAVNVSVTGISVFGGPVGAGVGISYVGSQLLEPEPSVPVLPPVLIDIPHY
jgi:hypothetical protein